MTIFEEDIWEALTADSGLSAFISDRIYQDVAPQKAVAPFIVLNVTDIGHEQCLSGGVVVSRPVLTFNIYAASHSESLAVGEALKGALLATSYPVKLVGEQSDIEYVSNLHRRSVEARVAHE